MSTDDVVCPYCGAEQEICHDDGHGYEEGVFWEQQCGDCDKYFVFKTYLSFSYDAYKADCLNGKKHKYKLVVHSPKCWPKWKRCTTCGDEVRGKYQEPELRKKE